MKSGNDQKNEHHASQLVAAWLQNEQFSGSDNALHYPSKKRIERLIETINDELFPGLTTTEGVRHNELFSRAIRLCETVSKELKEEIRKDLAVQDKTLTEPFLSKKTEQVVDGFLAQLPVILHLIDTDIEAARRGDPAAKSKQEVIIAYPTVRALLTYRLAHALLQLGVQFIPRIMTEWAHSKTGIDIHPGATIGKGLFIDHGTGVVIGETAVIGNNVRIYQGVSLAASSLSAEKINKLRGAKRHPTIEDNCVIYANASIFGGDTVIGANSIIAANVMLTKGVPPWSYVTTTAVVKRPIVFPRAQHAMDTSITLAE